MPIKNYQQFQSMHWYQCWLDKLHPDTSAVATPVSLPVSISAQNRSGHLDGSRCTASLHKKLLWRGCWEAEHVHYNVSFIPTHVNNSFRPGPAAHLPGFASVKLLKCWIQPRMLQLGSHHLLSQAQQTYHIVPVCSHTVVGACKRRLLPHNFLLFSSIAWMQKQ